MTPEKVIGVVTRPEWIFPVLVAAMTIAAFISSLQNGFVWDDQEVLLTNPHYRGLSRENLLWMFTTFHVGHYMPLTWLIFSLEFHLWEMNPTGYHLTNLLFHTANAVVLYLLALRLLGKAMPEAGSLGLRIGALCAAWFFSLHPLRVEVVAWVTAQRDLLAGFFFLLTIVAYLKSCEPAIRERNAGRWYWVAFITFGLSLLSKAIAVSMPVILLVLDVYPLRRLGGAKGLWLGPPVRPVWIEKLPFVVLSLAASGLALLAAARMPGNLPLESWGMANRAAVAVFGLVFYLWKTFVPLSLSPLYELPIQMSPLSSPYLLSGGAVLIITALAIRLRNRWPAFSAVWLIYVLLLLPVSGVFQTGLQMVADRYSYLSCLGWAVLAGAGAVSSWKALARWRPKLQLLIPVAVLALMVSLQVLTVRQIGVWRDSVTLWSHAATVDPESRFAHHNLVATLLAQEKVEKATNRPQYAMGLIPGEAVSNKTTLTKADRYFAVGFALHQRKDLKGAEAYYRKALESDPVHYRAWNDLGAIYAVREKFPEALDAFSRSLRIEPLYGPACGNARRVAEVLRTRPPEVEQCLKHESPTASPKSR
jgi:hypothetical protein